MAAFSQETTNNVPDNPSNNSPQTMETDSRCTPPLTTKPPTMNHRKWRAYLKKMKRKEKRVLLAKERDLFLAQNGGLADEPTTDSEEERRRQDEEAESRLQNERWLERERQAQLAFQAKKEWEEKERKKKEEIERKIKEEWEERVRREQQEQEESEKRNAEKRSKQDKLLKEATANENTGAWHNPVAPVQYGQERKVDVCPFFKKTGACRFGDQCSRFHDYPETSHTLLLPGMFSSFELEQSVVDNQDTDIGLEYGEDELYQSFEEFYEDVIPEFKKLGTVVQFKVCCNYEPHLRGNVYVQYKRESAAQEAFQKFTARWYGGRQLNCVFINIDSWKAAICGLAFRKRCPKGKLCNFLHVFRDPHGEFTDMDRDQLGPGRLDRDRRGEGRSHRLEDHRRRYHRRRSSRSPPHHHSRSHRQRHRSRSPHSVSRSPDSPRKSMSSHRSRSNRRSKSREGSSYPKSRSGHSRPRLRSRDRNGHGMSRSSHSRLRSKSRSKSPYRHQTRSRSRSRSRSREKHSRSKGSRSPHDRARSPYHHSSRSYRQKSRSRSRSPSPSNHHHHHRSESHSSSSSPEHGKRPLGSERATSVTGGSDAGRNARKGSQSGNRRSHKASSKKRKESTEAKKSNLKSSESCYNAKGQITDKWSSSSEEEYEYAEVTKETVGAS